MHDIQYCENCWPKSAFEKSEICILAVQLQISTVKLYSNCEYEMDSSY